MISERSVMEQFYQTERIFYQNVSGESVFELSGAEKFKGKGNSKRARYPRFYSALF